MHNSERVADVGFLSSIFLWVTSHMLDWVPILQVVSLAVAIIAGSLAAVVHGFKIWDRIRGRR